MKRWTMDLLIDRCVLCLCSYACTSMCNFAIGVLAIITISHSIKRAGRFFGVAYIIILTEALALCNFYG